MIYLAIATKKKFIVLPISLSVIVILSICGLFSSYGIPIKSQNKRFEEILKNKEMLVKGEIIKSKKELSPANKQGIIICFKGVVRVVMELGLEMEST